MVRPLLIGIATVLLIDSTSFFGKALAAGNESELTQVEKRLQNAGVKSDTDSLLNYLRMRTLSDSERAKLATTVRQLGDNAFEIRQQASAALVNAGRIAVPLLRQGLKDPDLEIVRRCERALEAIESGTAPALVQAVTRLLAARKSPAAIDVLLEYIASADDHNVEQEVMAALAALSPPQNKPHPALIAAMTDREPVRRAAAAYVLGASTHPEIRSQVEKLLNDAAIPVRFEAARALLQAGDKSAVSTMIALLTEAAPEIAYQAEEWIFRAAGDERPDIYLDLKSDEVRQRCRATWEEWWKNNETKVDLSRLTQEPPMLGFTVIADLDSGRISELGPDRKERWRIDGFKGPVDVQVLPNGRVLVAENHGSQVTERDQSGQIIWQKKTGALPASCQRLANGNTFIATYNQILEVTHDGQERINWSRTDGIYSARKLPNGHIVLLNNAGRIVTLDTTGKEIRSFETGGINSWSHLEILKNGHIIACCALGKIAEFDRQGKRIWEGTVPNAVCAVRLANGSTLACDSEGRRLVEVDRNGNLTWEYPIQGRPWHVYRR